MVVLETLAVAFSMFSAIPMPQVEWTPRNMRYALCVFPLIGLVIGACCWGWAWLCARLGLPPFLRGTGLCLLPVLITGGIHLEGYMDTWDALASRSTPQRRQEILKDPHVGAFAVIRLCIYFAAALAFWTCLVEYRPWAVIGMFSLSRTLSGMALTLFPLRPGSGSARSFADAADRKKVCVVLSVVAALLCVLMWRNGGPAAIVAVAPVLVWYYLIVQKAFGGLSGDLAGWFVQTAELWMLGALCLWPYLGRI